MVGRAAFSNEKTAAAEEIGDYAVGQGRFHSSFKVFGILTIKKDQSAIGRKGALTQSRSRSEFDQNQFIKPDRLLGDPLLFSCGFRLGVHAGNDPRGCSHTRWLPPNDGPSGDYLVLEES